MTNKTNKKKDFLPFFRRKDFLCFLLPQGIFFFFNSYPYEAHYGERHVCVGRGCRVVGWWGWGCTVSDFTSVYDDGKDTTRHWLCLWSLFFLSFVSKMKNSEIPAPPKRGGNSFLQFQNEKRGEVKAENPNLGVKGFLVEWNVCFSDFFFRNCFNFEYSMESALS